MWRFRGAMELLLGIFVILALLSFSFSRTLIINTLAMVLTSADKLLSSLVFLPPMLSWLVYGFLIGGGIYFALFGAHRTYRLRRARYIWVVLPLVLMFGMTLAAPEVELMMRGRMLFRKFDGFKPGEVAQFEGIEFVWIPQGKFVMGSPEGEPGRENDETPHLVVLTQGFWMSRYEITQGQWMGVMDVNPSARPAEFPAADTLPVDSVTWADCEEYVKRLNQAGRGYFRLPTEAEWEYACRADTKTAYAFGDDPAALKEFAWFAENSEGQIQPIGKKRPNAWGLYDMHGNAWEWCEDFYASYPEARATNPYAGEDVSEGKHTLRGGSFRAPPADCRAARRFIYLEGYFRKQDDIGFRIVKAEPLVPIAPPVAEPAPEEKSSGRGRRGRMQESGTP